MDKYDSMKIFVKVAELQSFTKASDLLNIPKASATTAVQELELRAQVKLLHRTTRSVSLTTEGLSFFERCKDILSDMDEMESMFQVRTAHIQGKIRIDMTNTMARDVVVPNLPSFLELYPEVEFELVGSDRKLDLIREGIDCSIRSGGVEDRGLAEQFIGNLEVLNVVSPAYIKKFGKPKKLEDLKDHRLIQYVQSFGGKPDAFEYFDGEKTREIKMKSIITVSSIDSYRAAALAGLGICQNPQNGVRKFLKSGELVEILPKFKPKPFQLKIVYPQQRFLAKRVRAFIDWVDPLIKKHLSSQ
jgi:DNA-binding transcriptional LysR family regulator